MGRLVSASHVSIKIASLLLATWVATGCDQQGDREASVTEAFEEAGALVPNTPYAVWPSSRKITAQALGDLLKQDEGAANAFCQQDANQPAGYGQHFSLVSTPSLDRAEVAVHYGLDPNLPILFGPTGKLLAPHLGDFLAQKGQVDPNNPAGRNAIKLTFSNQGRFAGYCEDNKGYTNVVNVVDEAGELTTFTTSCQQPAVVVCMSVR